MMQRNILLLEFRTPLGPAGARTVEQTDWPVTNYEMSGYASNILNREVHFMNLMVDRRMAAFFSSSNLLSPYKSRLTKTLRG